LAAVAFHAQVFDRDVRLGSPSTTRTRRPLFPAVAIISATVATVVDLPTPPFWLATSITRAASVIVMRET